MNSLRNRAAHRLVLEDGSPARLARIQPNLQRAALTAAARLLDGHLALGRRGQRFLVGDLRLADARFDAELALHAVDDDLEMQLAHAGDDGFARLFVGRRRGTSGLRCGTAAGPCSACRCRRALAGVIAILMTGSAMNMLSSDAVLGFGGERIARARSRCPSRRRCRRPSAESISSRLSACIFSNAAEALLLRRCVG